MKKIYNRDLVKVGTNLNGKKRGRWLGWMSFCLLFLMGTSGFAQETGTIQVGSGTGTVSGSSAAPISNYVYNYSQQIITASQYAIGGGLLVILLK